MFRLLHLRLRRLLFAVPLVAALLVVPATAASAEGPSADLSCTIISTSDVNPPLTLVVEPHASTSQGLTGPADCTGTVDGETVTGPGSFAIYTHGTGNCISGSASLTFVLRIPTTGGTKTVTGSGGFVYGAVPGTQQFSGDITGTGTIIAANGDCVTTPLSRGTIRLVATITT